MRALKKTLNVLSISPVLHHSACRRAAFFLPKDLGSCSPLPNAVASKRMSTSSTPSHSPSPFTPRSTPTFSYRIGASFSAKGRRFDPKTDVFTFNNQTQITSEQDVFTGRPNSGQDAFFVSKAGNSSNVAFGVADGVGGWADQGIDSADFSHGLCQGMARIARELHSPDKKDLWPQYILGNAYQEILREGKIGGGGSTACLATGDEDGNLKVAK